MFLMRKKEGLENLSRDIKKKKKKKKGQGKMRATYTTRMDNETDVERLGNRINVAKGYKVVERKRKSYDR